MMKKYSLILLLLISVLFLVACPLYEWSDSIVYIRHKNCDMPVLVKGNIDSGVFIVYIHGGPGGSSFIDIQNGYLEGIEKKYALVYYDQRSSGNSQGQSSPDLFTMTQYIEDLDVITSYVESSYSPSKLILLGHSWGGTLGSAYLLEHQNRYDAWIEVDGGHSLGVRAYEYSRDYVLRYIEENRNGFSANELKYWDEASNWYKGINAWRDPDILLHHTEYVTASGGYFFDQSNASGIVGIDQILFSETNFLSLLAQNKHVIYNLDVWALDYTERLGDIKIPSLVLWGKHDGILPVELAYEAAEALGTENLYVFMKSAHSPHYEEPDLFCEKVLEFVNTL